MPSDSTSSPDPLVRTDTASVSVGPSPVRPSSNLKPDKTQSENESPSSSDDPPEALEAHLINKTKQQIRSLVHEISELSQSQCTPEEFFAGFLTRTTNALASLGGAIWVRDSLSDPFQLQYHINLKHTRLTSDQTAQTRHGLLLQQLASQGKPTLVSPNSGTDDPNEAGNPTDSLLVICPIKVDSEVVGIVEIFQRPGAGPTTQRGYLRFVTQMADLASEYFSNQKIRAFAKQQALWQQLEQFIRSVHQGLDTRQTVYTIANEGRRLTEADRVCVVLGSGRQCRVESVSGLDSIERRADQVKRLGALAATVIRAGQPLWYNGDSTDLPPQIEKQLQAYVDQSHCKMLAILPLKESQPESEKSTPHSTDQKLMGALVIEQLTDSRISPALRQRCEVLIAHSETALTNVLAHQRIFLLPVWKTLGKFMAQFQSGKRVRTLALMGCLSAVVAALALIPYPFGLGAKGNLVPKNQSVVFAQVDGVLQEVFVSDSDTSHVQQGQLLARMTNNDLMVTIENFRGQIQQAHERLRTNQIHQSRQQQLDPADRAIIEGEIATAKQTILSLTNELNLKLEEAKCLDIVSPATGQVINWQVRQNLLRRPVKSGHNLMTIIDPNSEWQVELEMPERRLAHMLEAMRNSDTPLEVTFGLKSHPGIEYQGQVLHVDRQLAVHSENGNTSLIRVTFPNDGIDRSLLRSGTRVTAKVHCGTRSIGYAMFHELFETVQSNLKFWL